ncbi:hypothetical protein A1O1_03413 [Capronia coronata CBS 617.96]|uniref:Major facilitator superfamily (MFS) profile domain-containing protein n=1 Tax=Capronia coronata CBS 617.96 TaxID=1182541 RepID=W9Z719_9EURO|nr:uncharacterized protein A1O1_03413 [Capronia coronata CBS 617.96]EXJ90314.1 hypothetical protein A1O1_03413 [Capronia coronata CBS 617.96]
MRLTRKKTNTIPDNGGLPATQFFILSICRIAEPIAITAIFPYAWLMVKGFGMDDSSFYAGILIASFSFSESLTSLFWGGLSDRVGRKPVLLLGCFGTMLSLLMVGFSTNFAMALTGRIIGGALNGNIAGVIQSIVGELVTNPEYEAKAYSIMPFVWSIGTIIGPAIGGLLADPAKSYPNHFSRDGFFGRYPWLLPNLVCASFMLISIISGFFWLQETHPDFQPGVDSTVHHDVTEQTPMITAAGATADPGVDLRRDSFGTFNEVDMPRTQHWELNPDGTSRTPSLSEKSRQTWLTKKVAMLTLALSIYTYHSMCYDHLLPIFFQDKRIPVTVSGASPVHIPGGLGLSTKDVGVILSVNGVIALFIQAVIFPLAAERLGIWRTFVFVTLLHPVAFFMVPYLALLPQNLLYPGIYTCLTIRNLLSILDYPVILILLKQASPSLSLLGRINGLAASAGAACRTVSPPIAGLLYSWGSRIGFTGLAWWSAGAVAIVGVVQLWFVPRAKSETTVVKSILPCMDNPSEDRAPDVVDITVVDTEDQI